MEWSAIKQSFVAAWLLGYGADWETFRLFQIRGGWMLWKICRVLWSEQSFVILRRINKTWLLNAPEKQKWIIPPKFCEVFSLKTFSQFWLNVHLVRYSLQNKWERAWNEKWFISMWGKCVWLFTCGRASLSASVCLTANLCLCVCFHTPRLSVYLCPLALNAISVSSTFASH